MVNVIVHLDGKEENAINIAPVDSMEFIVRRNVCVRTVQNVIISVEPVHVLPDGEELIVTNRVPEDITDLNAGMYVHVVMEQTAII